MVVLRGRVECGVWWPERETKRPDGDGQRPNPHATTLAVFAMPKVSPEVWPRVVIFAQELTV